MKNLAYRIFPVLTFTLVLCGCGTLDRRHESADKISVRLNEVQAADENATASAIKESPPRNLPEERRLKINLLVFGLSYHPDRDGTRDSQVNNEFNPGLGLEYNLHDDALGVINSEFGIFKDSGSTWAKFAGMSYLFKLDEHWKLGADFLVIQSAAYNEGCTFVAPIPRLTYDFGPVILNGIYIPKYEQLNRYAVFGLYFTVPLRQ
jgi:hypothetical protein